jgi:hypothetical protein
MQHLKIAGLCLVSMLVAGMALTGTAFAAPLWLVCLEGANLTKYSNNQCTKAEASGKWQSQGLTTTDKVVGIEFTLTLTDSKTALGITTVRCGSGGEATGTVGPGNVEIVTTMAIKEATTNCRGIEGACESDKIEKIEARDLPWQKELFETEKKIQDKITADGHGEPGWAITCKTVLGSKTDTCTSEAGKPEIETLENFKDIISGVLLVFGENLKRASIDCTEGGKGSGQLDVYLALLLASGNGLSINPI